MHVALRPSAAGQLRRIARHLSRTYVSATSGRDGCSQQLSLFHLFRGRTDVTLLSETMRKAFDAAAASIVYCDLPGKEEKTTRGDEGKDDVSSPFDKSLVLERDLGHTFSSERSRRLLKLALGHASTAVPDNRSLAWLGDAVLYLLITERVLAKLDPKRSAGELNTVRMESLSRESCATLARNLGLERMILVGKSLTVQSDELPDSILAEAFEAVLGAVYIDGGTKAAHMFLENAFRTREKHQRD